MTGQHRVLAFLGALVLLAGVATVVVMMFLDPGRPAIRPAAPSADPERPASPATQPPVESRSIGPGRALAPADPVAIKPRTLTEADLMGVSGFVRDERDAPVEGASCELYEDVSPLKDMMQEGELHGKQRTEASGAFWFDRNALPPIDHFVIKVRHPSYATARKSVDARSLSAGGVVIVLKTGTRLSGRVTASGAVPLPGATVTVYDVNQTTVDPEGSVETSATADASGTWAIANVSPGTKRVLASASGYATAGRQSVPVAGAPLENLDLELRPAGPISGRVTATDGSLVEGAWVTARCTRVKTPQDSSQADAGDERDPRREPNAAKEKFPTPRVRGRDDAQADDPPKEAPPPPPGLPIPPRAPQPALLTLAARTGPDGRYSIAGAEIGTHVVNLTAPGFVAPGSLSVESPTQGADFVLTPGGRISGQVVDAETGQPVARFKVGISASAEPTWKVPVHTKHAFGPPKFQDGRFELREFSTAARFWLVAEAPGYAGGRSDEIVISQGERREGIVIRLVRGATIKGRVLDPKGEPVADAAVTLESANVNANPIEKMFTRSFKPDPPVRTDPTGRFEVPRVLAGTYVVTVRHDRFAPKTTPPVSVGPTGETVVSDVVMAAGASIRGVVRLKGGGPDPDATVQVSPAAAGPAPLDSVRTARTDAEGRYELGGLAVGQYRVSVIQREGKIDLAVVFKPAGEVVSLGEGEQRELNL